MVSKKVLKTFQIMMINVIVVDSIRTLPFSVFPAENSLELGLSGSWESLPPSSPFV